VCCAVIGKVLFCDVVSTEGDTESNNKTTDKLLTVLSFPNVKCREGEMVPEEVRW